MLLIFLVEGVISSQFLLSVVELVSFHCKYVRLDLKDFIIGRSYFEP